MSKNWISMISITLWILITVMFVFSSSCAPGSQATPEQAPVATIEIPLVTDSQKTEEINNLPIEQSLECPRTIPKDELYLSLINVYPENVEGAFSDEFQGLTHDNTMWFISQKDALWRIPRDYDLNNIKQGNKNTGGVLFKYMDEALKSAGFVHIGDISYHNYDNRGYLVVPLSGNDKNAIGLFTADKLELIGYDMLKGYNSVGWIAIDPDGAIYLSGDNTSSIDKYYLNWSEFLLLGVKLTYAESIHLEDESGSLMIVYSTQGGVFSKSGSLFYLVTSNWEKHEPNEGINVFDTTLCTPTWRRLIQSTNGPGYFSLSFTPYDEPEGITIWDNPWLKGIKGQLHVAYIQNEVADDASIWNYTTGPLPGTLTRLLRMKWDIDLLGSDYQEPFNPSKADPRLCQVECEKSRQCKAWTYVKPNGGQGPLPRCYLKDSVPLPTVNECCISGVSKLQWGLNLNGSKYKEFGLEKPDWLICQDECEADSECIAWTYDASTSPPYCSLFWTDSIFSPFENGNSVSGVK